MITPLVDSLILVSVVGIFLWTFTLSAFACLTAFWARSRLSQKDLGTSVDEDEGYQLTLLDEIDVITLDLASGHDVIRPKMGLTVNCVGSNGYVLKFGKGSSLIVKDLDTLRVLIFDYVENSLKNAK
jgi:hypothetical protein